MASGADVITRFIVRVARDAAGDGDDETRLTHDFAERARLDDACAASGGHLTNCSTSAARNRAGRLAEIACGKQMRRQQILGEDDELWPNHRGEDTAGQHPGHDLRPVGVARGIGGGKAIRLMRGCIEPAAKRAEQQQPEISVHHGRVGDEAGKNSEGGTSLQRKASSDVPRERADRQRAEPHAEDHGGYRQRREPFVRREHGTDNAGGANDDGVVSSGERLRDRQHHGVASRQIIIWHDVLEWFGDSRHQGLPGKKPPLLSAAGVNRHYQWRRSGMILFEITI